MMDFSVSMSVYDGDNPQYFEEALESVFQQTVQPTEVVLVVDGPISNTMKQIIQLAERKYLSLRVFYLPRNVGHGEARRFGLEQCSHELVAIMDSDDKCVPNRFERQLYHFEINHDLSVLGGQICEYIADFDHPIGIRRVPLHNDEIKKYLKSRCPFNQVSVMFRRSHVLRAGSFMDWYMEEDYYLWIRMALLGFRFQNLMDVLVLVRMTPDSYERRGGSRYFKSEAALQHYMYKNRIISLPRLVVNVMVRFVAQVVMPYRLRRWLFHEVFRSK